MNAEQTVEEEAKSKEEPAQKSQKNLVQRERYLSDKRSRRSSRGTKPFRQPNKQ